MAEICVTNAALNIAAIENTVAEVSNGAVCCFIGQVRRLSRGREVEYLEYDAYVPMAEKMLRKIGEEAEARWSCVASIAHRIGRIELGEASVVVAIGSPHRAEAFDACRWCIDTLKENVPIWKKEVCPDGTFWIEGENALKADDQ